MQYLCRKKKTVNLNNEDAKRLYQHNPITREGDKRPI